MPVEYRRLFALFGHVCPSIIPSVTEKCPGDWRLASASRERRIPCAHPLLPTPPSPWHNPRSDQVNRRRHGQSHCNPQEKNRSDPSFRWERRQHHHSRETRPGEGIAQATRLREARAPPAPQRAHQGRAGRGCADMSPAHHLIKRSPPCAHRVHSSPSSPPYELAVVVI